LRAPASISMTTTRLPCERRSGPCSLRLLGSVQRAEESPLAALQHTLIWPVQKLSWRDLTLRKNRDDLKRRPDEGAVRGPPGRRSRAGDGGGSRSGAPKVRVTKRDSDGARSRMNMVCW
jgi:hypothetical protein